MGSISEADIQKVREASDLVAIVGERTPLRQRGRDFWCCCPFHDEKTPSFKVDPSTQLWHCFGCGEGGDVFSFVEKIEDLSFPEAVHWLADRAHIEIVEEGGGKRVGSGQKARLKEVCEASAEYFHTQLMRNPEPGPSSARSYLQGRGFGGTVPKDWKLGYAPGRGALVRHLRALGFSNQEMLQANVAVERNGSVQDRFYDRVMFPINDAQGECIAFGGRVIGKGEPKYLNTQETPIFHKSQVLYGLDKAKASMASTGTAIVTEGYTDVIAMFELGIKNVVATLGTALTTQHIRLLSRHARKRIVYLFDGDEAGQRAADRALNFIGQSMDAETGTMRIDLLAVTIPEGLDPVEYLEAHGPDALVACLDDAKPLLQYGIDRRLDRADLGSAEGRAAAFADALSVLAPIKDSGIAKDYARQIASRTGVREEVAMDALYKLKAPRAPQAGAADAEGGPSAPSAQEAPRPQVQLPQSEIVRRRYERQLLSVCAQHPVLALQHADTLAQTHWHDAACGEIAPRILDTLSDDPGASAARLVSDAARTRPEAASILTEPLPEDRQESPESYADYLVERIAIDDAQEEVEALRARLSDASLSEEESQLLLQVAAGLQQDITRRSQALEG